MPELPEIEVLRLSLEPHLPGDTIASVEVADRRLREPIEPRRLRRDLVDRRILRLRRRSKYLLVDVEGDRTFVVHLGMSGRLLLTPGETPPGDHEHVTVHLASGRRLRFRDPRRFGLVFSRPTASLEEDRHFAHLGIEPLAGGLDGAFLVAAAQKRRGPVKTFLMDGRIVVGVGNIYASEALFGAGVHPSRSVARIAAARWENLAEHVRRVLAEAIRQGGTTLNDFADGEGNSGYFQIELQVYGREGEPCRRCGRAVRRVVHAGRSTFYCPGCQR